MAKSLKSAWRDAILAGDYDAHMREAGQAQANARLVEELLRVAPPPRDAAILVAGAGTGQMFDFMEAAALSPFVTTFTDINGAFLSRLAERLSDTGLRFETVLDDIETSSLNADFALAIAVLVLEYVDCEKAVATLCRAALRVFVVIQETPAGVPAVRTPVGTVAVLRETPPHAVALADLEAAFARRGYARMGLRAVPVPDGKRMIAVEFARCGDPAIP